MSTKTVHAALFFPRLVKALVFGFAILGASMTFAQTAHSMFDCERQSRECEMRASKQTPGNDPCSAYSRCQAKKMCEASRCVCKRTHGSADPALAAEAQSACYAVLRPHAGNSCDRYIDACTKWSKEQHEKQKPNPSTPSGMVRPDQLPR